MHISTIKNHFILFYGVMLLVFYNCLTIFADGRVLTFGFNAITFGFTLLDLYIHKRNRVVFGTDFKNLNLKKENKF